jgi:hypothetical protein
MTVTGRRSSLTGYVILGWSQNPRDGEERMDSGMKPE